jgi:hypothetical protein
VENGLCEPNRLKLILVNSVFKFILDSSDEGYWIQIEEYIRVHSEAVFTHGICEECAKKLYPQYYKE